MNPEFNNFKIGKTHVPLISPTISDFQGLQAEYLEKILLRRRGEAVAWAV